MCASAAASDLLTVRDHQGVAHLAMVSMEESESDWRPDVHGSSAQDLLLIRYFSDHPGNFVRRNDAVGALDDLRRSIWYLAPLQDELLSQLSFLRDTARAAVEEAIHEQRASKFLACTSGQPAPTRGKWILRGTNHAIEFEADEVLPRYAFFPESLGPAQWCHWDLRVD